MDIPPLPLITWFSAQWQDVKEFFNSVFFTAIVGAFAASFAGAYGAQRLAERNRYRDQLLKEIRDTNAAIMVSFGICNALLAVKQQHIKPLKDNYERERKSLADFREKRRAGHIARDTEFRFTADFQTLSLPPLPITILQTQIFEKLSLLGRPLNLATTLAQTLHSLTKSLEARNELIDLYKTGKKSLTPQLYFGLPDDDIVNQDIPSSVEAVHSQTDDGIFFSHLLCMDLVEHGNEIAVQFKRRFGEGAPRISHPEFEKAETGGLMPDAKNYADWVSAFKKREQPNKKAKSLRGIVTIFRDRLLQRARRGPRA